MSEYRAKSLRDIARNQAHSEDSALNIPDHQNMTQISHDLSQLEASPYHNRSVNFRNKKGWDRMDNMSRRIEAIE